MPISHALEKSAKSFCLKYSCVFSFAAFDYRVEEFTFLRPNGGWIEAYMTTFDELYKMALVGAASGTVENLDGEAMLGSLDIYGTHI